MTISRKPYPFDVSDEEWALVAPYLALLPEDYATESMLVLDPATGRYDANATPSTGSETLFDFYARSIAGEVTTERGDHAVF